MANPSLKVSYQLVVNLNLAYTIEHYADLTFPDIKRYAQAKAIVEPLLGIVASIQKQPCGLLLAENKRNSLKILTWFVQKQYRSQGIGENLLLKLEKVVLKNNAFDTLFIDYDAGWSSSTWLEAMFKKHHWKISKESLWMCITVRERITQAQAPWLNKMPGMAGFELFDWQALTLLDRQQLLNEKFYPPIYDPFVDEGRIAFAYSYGMRKDKKVIGWLITHQISATSIQYSNFFIDSAYRKNGHAIALLIKAINQQVSDNIFDKFVFQVSPESSLMSFFKKRLEPYLVYKSIMKSSYKILKRT